MKEENAKVSQSRQQLDVEEEEEEARGNWGNQCDFMLSCIGYAVGLGNVWRFPYLCYINGGGAFLIPYTIMLLFAGLPTFFMELTIGQYASLGPNMIFRKMCPIFQGLGYSMLFITFLVATYYNVIIAWTIFYTFASFTSELGWAECGHEYNTKNCYSTVQENHCLNQSVGAEIYFNNTCYGVDQFCTKHDFGQLNNTHCLNDTKPIGINKVGNRISSSEDYFRNYMLYTRDASWDNFGQIRWQLVLCLLLAWLIVGLCLIKGVKSSGKVVYFTALFPYVVLFILFCRGVTLDGALDGIKFYIIPDFNRLKTAKVWADAATQIFYSLGPSFGGLITLASYNKFKNNCMRDAIVVSFCNCLTSVFAGFVIFSILGFMAKEAGKSVGDVVASGPGLAFIAYPEAVTKLPISPLWAFLFFAMLITLGLDSQFTMVETLTTALFDQFPGLRNKKGWIVMGACLGGFILGLVFTAQGGIFMFTLLDWYSAGWSLLIVSVTEIIVVSWVYGYDRVMSNIENDMGIWVPAPLKMYWMLCWRFITPTLLTAVLIFSFYNYTPASYGGYEFPWWANMIGWFMAFGSVILIPAFAIYRFRKGKEVGRELITPTADWGPAHERKAAAKATAMESAAERYKAASGFDNDGCKKSYDNTAYSSEDPPPYYQTGADKHI